MTDDEKVTDEMARSLVKEVLARKGSRAGAIAVVKQALIDVDDESLVPHLFDETMREAFRQTCARMLTILQGHDS
jgi:hypothetical protein